MRFSCLFAAIVCCTAALSTAKAGEVADMAGSWEVVDFYLRGEKMPAPTEVRFDSDGVFFLGKDKNGRDKGYLVELNSGGIPKWIDLTEVDNGLKVNRGIYSLSGNSLRICFGVMNPSANKSERPKSFNTNDVYLNLKRK